MKRIAALLLVALLAGLPALAAENGIYAADVCASDDAFGFTDAVVLVSDAGITLRVTAADGGGEALYAGGEAILPAVNAAGEYAYTLPLGALDAPAEFQWDGADGVRHALTLSVASDTLVPLRAGNAPDEEAGEAGAVSLEDGEYAVASFGFSGGSGRVGITCERIWVQNGAATARITFSSPHYGYVEVDGARYEGEHTGDRSSFDIPVRLGAETIVVGMTTAMSVPHEIEYALRVVPGERLDP